jgi:hypothetical protein
MCFERSEEEARRNLTLTGSQAEIEHLWQLHFQTALALLLMLRRSRKHRGTSIEPAWAYTLGAAAAAVDIPSGIRAIDSGLAQYMRQLGSVRACAILEVGQLSRLGFCKMATIL